MLAQKTAWRSFLAVINRPYVVTVSGALFALASLLLTALLSVRRGWCKDDPIFGSMLFAGAITHLVYIFFISNLWARYFWIGMAMSVFAVCRLFCSFGFGSRCR